MPTTTTQLTTLVTGAAGFIGQVLVRHLVTAGHTVLACVLPEETDCLPDGVQGTEINVTDAEAVAAVVTATCPDLVFHLAAVGVTHPDLPVAEALSVNVLGTVNVIEAARKSGSVRRVVAIGSSYEYGARATEEGLDPFSIYSASKVAAWAFARAAYHTEQAPVVWVRPFQVYGPGQNPRALIPSAIRAGLRGEDFQMTAGEQLRDFIYIEDVVHGLVAAAMAPSIDGRALDLGTGTLWRIRDVVERIWDLTQASGRVLAGALPYRPGEVTAIPAATERTRRLTGWEASTPLEDGLRNTIAFERDLMQGMPQRAVPDRQAVPISGGLDD